MGIFDGIIILSDLDGTLLDHGKLSLQHLDAIRYFINNGGIFCPATGRSERYLFENYPKLPMKSYCIVKNGTAIYDCACEKYIWYKSLDREVWSRLLHLLVRFPDVERVAFHTVDDFITLGRDELLKRKTNLVSGEILKIVLWKEDAQEIAKYCKQFEDYQYLCSSDFLFEILPRFTGKGICTKILRTCLKDKKCFVGIGDYENDISLLEAVDIAVAVDGGFMPLKNYADWIAPPVEEHPIAWLVNKLKEEISAGRFL